MKTIMLVKEVLEESGRDNSSLIVKVTDLVKNNFSALEVGRVIELYGGNLELGETIYQRLEKGDNYKSQ